MNPYVKCYTGQLIVNEATVLNKLNYNYTSVKDIAAIKDLRDSIEQSRLKQIKYSGLYKTLIGDELFFSFNELYQSLNKDEELPFKLKQLEEQWGFWLHKINLDETVEIKLSRVSFHSYLKEMKLQPHSVIRGEDSFYYSIIHQLKHLHIETNKASNIDKLKHLIINHIIDNPSLYNNAAVNIEKFANDYFKPSKWNDDLFIKAVSRILEVNIILIKSDNSYKYYKRVGATETLYIAHEIDGDYSSLVKNDLTIDYDTMFQTNVEIDTIQVNKPSTSRNISAAHTQAEGDIVPTAVNNNDELENNLSIQLQSGVILDYFNALEAKLAKNNGEQKQQQARAAYEQFKQEVLTGYNTNKIAKNPSYETLQANLLLKLDSYDQAIMPYDKAIELDAIYSFVAHYNKAHAVTEHSGGVDDPKSDLLAAKDQLEGHLIPQLESTQMVLISNSDVAINSELTKQITNKINLLKLQLDHINKALTVIATVEHKNKVTKDAVAAGTIEKEQASTFKIAIDETKKLKEFYEQTEIPEDEIAELEHLGLDHLFTVKEVEIVPEKDDDGLLGAVVGCVLGIGQIVFGAVVAACGGVSLGIAMIVEGVKDLYTVVTGGFNQGFSLENYFSSKAISYTVSIIAMGWDNFKLGLQAVKESITVAATGIKNVALQALGKETIKQGVLSEATKSVTSEGLVKSAFEIAKKAIPEAILSVGAQHAINFVSDQVADNIVKEFRDDISNSVRGKINNVINDPLTANVIDRSVLIDTMLDTNKFTAHIMNEMALILRPEESAFINAASTIIKAIAKQYHSGIATCISLAEKAATVNKILDVTERFCHKLISKLSGISSELPSNQEVFNIYMQYYISSDDSIAIYNTLINEKILSNEGKVVGEELSKINDINFGQNNKLKSMILSFCVKLKGLQAADNKEVRTKVASNVEHMITNRIMHLIKAEILSPAINSGISELSNAMTNKLHQASQAAKAGVKHEMSKYYNRVVLTTDATDKENQISKAYASQSSSHESFDRTKKTGSAASKPTSLLFVDQGHDHSVLFPHTEGSLYLESVSNQMSRPIHLFKNGQLDRIIGSQYKGVPGFNLDYVMGQGWKKHDTFNSNQPPRSLYDLVHDEAGATNASILLKKSEDPRLKFHTPYNQYLNNKKTVNNTKLGEKPPTQPKNPPATPNIPQSSWDYTLAMLGIPPTGEASVTPKTLPSGGDIPKSILFKSSNKPTVESTEFKWTEEGMASLLAASHANKVIPPIPPLDIMVREQSLPTTSRTIATSDISVEGSIGEIDPIKNLSDNELRAEFGSVTSGIKYIFSGPDAHGAKIIAEHKKRFPDAEGQRNIEVLGQGLALTNPVIKLAVEKVIGDELPGGTADPTDFIPKRVGLPTVSGAKVVKDTTPKPKIIEGKAINPEVPGTSGLAKEPHLPTLSSDITAKAKIVENPYLTKNYLKELKDITKLPVDEKQLPLLKEALKTQEFSKLSIVEKDAHRIKFNNVKNTLIKEWEQNTGRKWPVYEEHPNPDRIGYQYDAHHLIQIDHGGPNTWWNIHPAHGVTEHPKIHGTGSTATQIFKPKKQ